MERQFTTECMEQCKEQIRHIRHMVHQQHPHLRLSYVLTSHMLFDAYCIATYPIKSLSADLVPDEILCHQTAVNLVHSFEYILRCYPSHLPAQIAADFVRDTNEFLEAHKHWDERIRQKQIMRLKETIIQLYDTKLVLPVLLLLEPNELLFLGESIATSIDLTRSQLQCLGVKQEDVTTSAFYTELLSDPFALLNEPLL